MNDFIDKVVATLRDYYGADAEVNIQKVLKNNGQYLTGLSVRFANGSNIAPVIYMEAYFNEYENGMNFEEILERIIDVAETHKNPEGLCDAEISSNLMSWDFCKERIYPILVSTERNIDLLENLISTQLLDLSVLYTIRLSNGDEGMATVKVTKDLLKNWDKSVEELHAVALNNMKNDQYEAMDMAQVIAGMLGEDELDMLESQPGPRMMVLSNKTKMYAAAGVLDKEYMDNLTHGKRCFMLPSSVHEVIFLPAEEGMDTESLNAMIQEVNETQVAPDEILSNHAYLWADGRLQMCA